ncbi:MAG TPA: DUF4112 domain-containing protein [Chitinophagales bacterium]|jgi:hypothetical protein|nr:DUF4112 domain-containing protein [Chitinophagales bacterium]MBP6153210.1 DUF4112 domain-containing protein [Chitinophagales bacterium]HQV78888.1 DUF4112 domain-containing protein [Chitinophagales bacterium]HQW79254.1 DUF4112 domain-containing protein [Chitinophagales bacterium]HRB91767.1 DUF4112 domain-containing protein [Chitinophagales bacterium]
MSEINNIAGKPIPPQLQKLAIITKLMDSQFKIPGTKITFGIDPIIGLVPWIGDLIDYCISAYLMVAMIRNGASGKVVAKMLRNITVDGLVGLIPFLGRIFDIFYKANRRNLILAVEHFEEGKHQGSAWPIVLPILGFLVVLFMLIAVLGYYVLKFLYLLIF